MKWERHKRVANCKKGNNLTIIIMYSFMPLRTEYLAGENGRLSLGWSRSRMTSGNERNY